MNVGGFRVSWLRRGWWVIAASVIGVVAVTLVISPPSSTVYTAESVLVIRSGATVNTPGSANEANRLAVTYAELIPQDIQVLERISRSLNVPTDVVEDHLDVVNDPSTSILRIRFTASRASVAVNGSRVAADALAGGSPASPNFNGLALSRLPANASPDSSGSGRVPLAILLGLGLGVVLVVLRERINGRIEDKGDLEERLSCPVTALEELSPDGMLALLERWSSLSLEMPPEHVPHDSRPTRRVALITSSRGYRSLTTEVATVLGVTAAPPAEGEGSLDTPDVGGLLLCSGGAPATSEVGERLVQRANLTVLVVPEGASTLSLEASLKSVAEFGSHVGWALFASSRIVRRAKRGHPSGEAISVKVAVPMPSSTNP